MKTLFNFFYIVSFFALLNTAMWGQTTIYTQNFGSGGGSLPTGWTATAGTNTWAISTSSASSGYTGVSGGNNVVATNHANLATLSLTYNNSLSTVGYINITVIWGARRTSTFTSPVTFSWSVDGSTWNNVSYTEVSNTSTWALVNGGTRLTLPVGAEGASNLQFRWTWTQLNNAGTYRIDDFNVQGTASGPTITLNTTGFNGAFGFVKVGNSSATSSFTVSGTSLTNDIIVTPPTGFEIRTGVNPFSTSAVTLTQSGGSVPVTTIDVRFTPLANIKYSENVACASTGAGTQNVPVSGTGGLKSVASGNWSSPSTWDGGAVPTSSDNVYINAAFPVIVDDGSAVCNSIDFDPVGISGLLSMGSSGSMLSVYGDFTLGNSTQNVFASWPAGAKIKFTGSTAVQTLSGWNTGTTLSTVFMEVQVDKSAGKITTSGTNMKLTLGSSLEIINGIFEVAATDDIFGRDLTGSAATPTITVQSGGTFSIASGATQINTGTSGGSGPIGKMTIYGTAELTSTSTAKINLGNIDIESGGTLRLMSGWDNLSLKPGTITIKNNGTLRYSTTATNIWDAAASVVLNAGGTVLITTTSKVTMPPSFTDNGGTFRYSLSGDQTGVLNRTYEYLELAGSGVKTLDAGASIVVNGKLSLMGSATLNLGVGGIVTYGPSSTLQYGALGQITPQTSSDTEFPTSNGPLNLTIYNSGGVTLHASRIINGTLTLTEGLLSLGSNDLTLGPSASVAGSPSDLNMVVAEGSGLLVKQFLDGAEASRSFTFPIGDNTGTPEYSPITLNFTSGNFSSSSASVNLKNSMTSNYLTPPVAYLNRCWYVQQGGISSFSCDVTCNYVQADVVGNENLLYCSKYDGYSNWSIYNVANTTSNELTGTVSFFSEFTGLDLGATPVELSSFNANAKNGLVQLTWKTTTETNSLKFDVERKSANTEWIQIGEVAASGNSNSPKEYSFIDRNVKVGKTMYRLKMIDADGSYNYSSEIEVEIEMPKEYGISQNYPNPFNPTTRIDYQLPFDSKVRIELYGITGEKIATLIDQDQTAGYYTTEVDAGKMNLASGSYIYRISAVNQNSEGQSYVQIKKLMMTK